MASRWALLCYLTWTKMGKLPARQMRHTYLGHSFKDEEVESLLRAYKLRHTHLNTPAETAAELLAQGKILGWFQGRTEFGPRALGNRSILADPRIAEIPFRLNTAVKYREWWRPFASFHLGRGGRLLHSGWNTAVHVHNRQRPTGTAWIDSGCDSR